MNFYLAKNENKSLHVIKSLSKVPQFASFQNVGKYCLTIVKFVAENEKCASTSGRIIAANISKHCFPKRFIILNYFITKNELFFVFHTMLF